MSELTAGDQIGALIGASLVAVLLAFPFTFATSFERMFEDFGTELPTLTRITLRGAPVLFAAVSAGLLTLAKVRSAAPLRERRRLIVAAFIVGALGCAGSFFALYLPIFALAGSIQE